MSDDAHTYGHLANKSEVGYKQILEDESSVWVPAFDGAVRLYALGTENVLFEHLGHYGGQGWATFMTVVTLICIVLYLVTSSDSASYMELVVHAFPEHMGRHPHVRDGQVLQLEAGP